MTRDTDTAFHVMAGLGPAIHAFLFVAAKKPVDGRNKSGRDDRGFGWRLTKSPR
jgi:hypothetical protein